MDDTAGYTALLEQFRSEVERITRLRSRWNGRVILLEVRYPDGTARFISRKEWSCEISVHADYVDSPRLASTALHELLHSVSVGLTDRLYADLTGWEEGVVEQLTRLLRPEVFARVAPAATVSARPAYFDNWILALETLRERTSMPQRDYYLALLSTPLDQRRSQVLRWIVDSGSMRSAANPETALASPLRILERWRRNSYSS